jgi:hypothetical protein
MIIDVKMNEKLSQLIAFIRERWGLARVSFHYESLLKLVTVLLNFLSEVVGYPTCCSPFVKGLIVPSISFRIRNNREIDWREAESNDDVVKIRFKPLITK